MNKKLDLIKLAKGMSVQDKAKLLFADCMKKFETMGEERLLSALELDTLVEDARKNNQIDALNSLIRKFNISCSIINEIKINYLHFHFVKSRLEIMATGILVRNHYESGIDMLIYDLAREGYTDVQLEEVTIQHKIDKKANALRERYGVKATDKFSSMFDLFDPPITPESYFITHFESLKHQANILIQEPFMDLVTQAKSLKKAIRKIRYLEEIAGLDLLDGKLKHDIEIYEASLTELEQLGGLLSSLKLYQFDEFINKLNIDEIGQHPFFQTIKNISSAIELSEEDKVEAENYIKTLLKLI